MKKLSTLVFVLLAGGLVHAQRSDVPMKSPAAVNYRGALTEKQDVHAPAQAANNRAVIWSDDFSTPANWAMSNTSAPARDWVISTSLPSNITSQGFAAAINSTSGGNFAWIDSDGAPGGTQNSLLTTVNAIDCSANPHVSLTFQNFHRRYMESHSVEVSNDGGATWTTYPVNTTYLTNTNSPNAETVQVNITAAAGNEANVTIRFRYQGAWDWFWAVDDVEVVETPEDELILSTVRLFSATPSVATGYRSNYTIIPTSEISPMLFTGNLNNQGAVNQANSRLSVEVINASASNEFSGDATSATLNAGANRNDTVSGYTPAAAEGVYRAVFTANYDNLATDATPADNVDTLRFWIDDTQYARDRNVYTGSGLWNGETGGLSDAFVMGNAFQIQANKPLYSIDLALSGNTDEGAILCVQLYEIAADFTLVAENCDTPEERTVTAADISSGGVITWVKSIFPTPYILEAGKEYLAAVKHSGGPEALVIMAGGPVAENQTVFVLDGTTWYYMTTVPMIRMGLSDPSVPSNISELEQNNLQVAQNIPNPFDLTSVVNFSLNKPTNVTLDIVDLTGKIVLSENLGARSSGNHQYTINGSQLAAGVYYYSLTAGSQKITRKMVVTH